MLNDAQKKFLRGRAHPLKPVVMIASAGLSKSVTAELDSALNHHELIKVRVRVGDRAARDDLIRQICADHQADLVQGIGNTAVFYRKNTEIQGIVLPD
jgi:RNA-binding protein